MADVEQGLAIEWSAKAIRDMRRIAPRDRKRIIAKIEQYAGDTASLVNQFVSAFVPNVADLSPIHLDSAAFTSATYGQVAV